MKIKFPEITVDLSEMDGNAFSIIGRTSKALRRGGVPKADIDAFIAEATDGDYDHLLQTVMATVDTS